MKKTLLLATLLSTGAFANIDYVPGELIVKYKTSPKKLNASTRILNLRSGHYAVVKVSNKFNLKSEIERLKQDPNIEYAEPNYIYHAIGKRESTNMTVDPRFGDLWGLQNNGTNEPPTSNGNSSPTGVAGADINAENAWDITRGDRRVKIAVIDTGVDYNHPDLVENIWTNTAEANGQPGVDDDGNGYIDDIHGYDFANDDGDPMDGNGHGTHCSGTIAASHDNNIGIAGVMAHAEIVGVKFLTDQGSGSTEGAIRAIDYATSIGVDIMSNSWGGGGHSQALKEAIERAEQAGIIFTAAAGNSASNNDNTPHYPSNYDVSNVISVAAHNYNDQLASFSCYGAQTVHVAAPGRNILSTTPGNSYDVYSGTSMATPHVTGVVGLYIAHYGSSVPGIVRSELMASSVYGTAYGRRTSGGGRVDAFNLLQRVVTSRPETPNSDDWQGMSVEVFETPHPYASNTQISRTYSVPGARFLRAVVANLEIEANYDSLKVYDGSGNLIQTLDGTGQNIKSDYVEGDTITIEFKSDSSIEGWGVSVSELEFIN